MPNVLAVDLGGTKVLAAIIDQDGSVLARGRRKVEAVGDWPAVVDGVAAAVDRAVAEWGKGLDEVIACGIGVPGPVDHERGHAFQLPNLSLHDVPVAESLSERLGMPTVVENDVDAGLYGEVWRGAARGRRHVVGMFPGTGLGGAVVVDGVPLRGKTGITGEVGHMVMDPSGPRCGCGRKGCLEAYASRTAMQAWVQAKIEGGAETSLSAAIEGSAGRLGSRAFLKAAEEGDELALSAIRRVAKYLGYAAANLIHLLSPEMIVLGGGVIEALAPYMMDRIREVAKRRCLPGCYDDIEIVPAACGDDAGILGVAALTLLRLGYAVA